MCGSLCSATGETRTPYQLFRADEDAAINPALAFRLQHDFGITLPTFDDEDEENIDGLLIPFAV